MIKRLFDIIELRHQSTPDATMLAAKENGNWVTYSVSQVRTTAFHMAGAMQSLFFNTPFQLVSEAQPKVAIISPNRPEWMITDIATQLTGAILTPIYPTISPDELMYVLGEAEAQIVFVANEDIYNRFKNALAQLPHIKAVYSFDHVAGVEHWQALVERQIMPQQGIIDAIKDETLATIIYTSGTTGNPKGVMLTHANIVNNVQDSMPVFSFANEGSKALSFLPLNHIFERMVTYVYLQAGVAIYYAESMDTIGLNLKEVQPIVFTTVPRLLEKVYERILNTGSELKGIKKALFFWALNLAKKYDNTQSGSLGYQLQLSVAKKLIFKKWQEALGGQVKAIVVGSAACQERLVRIFTAAGITIMEGYGLTETSPVVSVNRYENDGRRFGTIGPLIQNVSVKLAEDGEILIKGKNVTSGYYKHPELTAAAIDAEGWFHSGDIGIWVEDKFLKITDRKKEIFKTSGGKYVAPQVIENKMKESNYIEQMMVIGNGRKFVAALVVPSFVHLRKHLRQAFPQKSIPESNEQLIKLPEVMSLLQAQIDKFNEKFSHPEQVKKIALLAHEWTVDTGELTPSLKIKRKVIEAKYQKEIEGIYED